MHAKKRLSILAVALSTSLAACEGSLPTGPTSGLETGEAALSLARLTAPPVVIDFESLASPNDVVLLFEPYSEDGFTLTNSTGFFVSRVGSTALVIVDGESKTDLYKDDGGVFNVASIAITEASSVGPLEITFTGTREDESDPAPKTFTTDGEGLQKLVFPASFTNLTSLSWV